MVTSEAAYWEANACMRRETPIGLARPKPSEEKCALRGPGLWRRRSGRGRKGMGRAVVRVLGSLVAAGVVAFCCGAAGAAAGPPVQRLPAALLMYPLVESGGGRDTRIQLTNLSGFPIQLDCFYVYAEGTTCTEVGFVLSLTPFQPFAWLASEGTSNVINGTAAPPFFGTGELKCAVVPPEPDVRLYNAIEGRATVFGSDGSTVSYTAYAFQRFADGEYDGVLRLDGQQYAQCPDRLQFLVLTDTPASRSELILLPCSQDLLLQSFSTVTAQLLITNEYGQTLSSSYAVGCYSRRFLGEIADFLNRATAGTDTARISVRGVREPLIGLVIDAIPYAASLGSAGNEPFFQGGRSATITVPRTQ